MKYASMKRKRSFSLLLSILIGVAVFSGCLGGTTEEDGKTVSAALNTMGLPSTEIPSGYEKTSGDYISSTFKEQGGFLDGYILLEKYDALYIKDDLYNLYILLARLESSEQTNSALNSFKSSQEAPPFNFEEIELSNEIGDESYLGSTTIELYPGMSVTMYGMAFRIADVIVAITASGLPQSTILEYASVIEGNIHSSLTDRT